MSIQDCGAIPVLSAYQETKLRVDLFHFIEAFDNRKRRNISPVDFETKSAGLFQMVG